MTETGQGSFGRLRILISGRLFFMESEVGASFWQDTVVRWSSMGRCFVLWVVVRRFY